MIRKWVQKGRLVVPLLVGVALSLLLANLYYLGIWSDRREIAVFSQRIGHRIIVIDPGHGGIDGGAEGPTGVREEDVVLGVAKHLARYFEMVGARVILTREKDEDLGSYKVDELDYRLQVAREANAEIFISIHANSFPSPHEFGAQTFYWSNHPLSEVLAKEVQRALVEGIDILGYNYREVMMAEYYLLRNLDIPAVLVEVGFLSNPREEALLRQTAYQDRLAWSIFVGTVGFFTQIEQDMDQEEETGGVETNF